MPYNKTNHVPRLSDLLFDYRKVFVCLIVLSLFIMGMFLPWLEQDLSLKTMMIPSSGTYSQYDRFLKDFGNDEFTLIAIKRPEECSDSTLLACIDSITKKCEQLPNVTEVISVTNLHLFQQKKDKFGNYLVITSEGGRFSFPPSCELDPIRRSLPFMDLLISFDQKTAGILVCFDDRHKFDIDKVRSFLSNAENIVRAGVPANSEWRIVGGLVTRDAVVRYGFKTVIIFSALCSTLCLAVTFLVFRSIKTTLIVQGILCLCGFSVLCLMAVLRFPLTAMNSLAPGLVLVQTLEFIIHVIIRFQQFRPGLSDSIAAGRETVRFLARPCLFCAGTTAIGYGSSMVSDIPGVFQMALLMSAGTMLSFFIALVVTSSAVVHMKCNGKTPHEIQQGSRPSDISEGVISLIRLHHRKIVYAGFILVIFMLAGIPRIRTDPQLIRELGNTSKEALDLDFVQTNLTSAYYLEVVLHFNNDLVKNPQMWKQINEAEESIRRISDVVATESLFHFLNYMQKTMNPQKDLINNLQAFPQLVFAMSSTSEGEKITGRYLDDSRQKARISVRVSNSHSTTLPQTIDSVKSAAAKAVEGFGNVEVTGVPIIFVDLGRRVIESQIHSIAIGVILISFLMIIQMGTVPFGLVALIPNIPPMVTAFGLMGWLGIPLGGITMFAATVALGLAVDNTIQFVSQLKREIRLNPGTGLESCVLRAYRFAVKPMASWSIVTILGFLAMVFTPFQVSKEFGIITASAMAMGMFGDLLLMQSMILMYPSIRKIIYRVIEKEKLKMAPVSRSTVERLE